MHLELQLSSPRLKLTPVSEADLHFLQALWNNVQVRRYLFDDAPVSAERAAAALRMCQDAMPRGGGLWLIRSIEHEQPIGCVGLYEADASALLDSRLTGLLEPIVAIEPGHWGRGYAVEALQTLLRHAFDKVGLPVVGAANDAPNIASGRALERVGFVVLGDWPMRGHVLRTYLLTRGRWASLAASTG